MENEIFVPEVACPVCGEHNFYKSLYDNKVYKCCKVTKTGNDETYCPGVLYYCKTCNKITGENSFGKHGDVWECKECGTVCWGLTDRKRAMEKYNSVMSSVSSLMNSLGR